MKNFFSLVSGDVEGKLGDVYSKVKTIQSKAGKFDVEYSKIKKILNAFTN